jgi:hypothetical protein
MMVEESWWEGSGEHGIFSLGMCEGAERKDEENARARAHTHRYVHACTRARIW